MDFTACSKIIENISNVIVGKEISVKMMMVALLADGHLLLEDVPGVGKTVLAKTLAASIGGIFKRIQFTPDLLPSDITGFNFYVQNENRFEFREGPVMAHILLADEINRTVPRTQSSLLESMEERQVTIDGKTHTLPEPFFVVATQNPVELEGTFPLPEAQLDRFLLKIDMGYPEPKEEIRLLKRFQTGNPITSLEAIVSPEQIAALQKDREKVIVSDPVLAYITQIVQSTREHEMIKFGASPRGSLALMRAGQALAAIEGRDYVLPDDIKTLVPFVLAHRLILKDRELLKGQTPGQVLHKIVENTEVPDGSLK